MKSTGVDVVVSFVSALMAVAAGYLEPRASVAVAALAVGMAAWSIVDAGQESPPCAVTITTTDSHDDHRQALSG